ncbi:MAG: methylated-DNA--[protein]-cysteine S-methyltransferase [Lacisediminihabitans sp.]
MTPSAPRQFLRRVDSPIGTIELIGTDTAIVSLTIERAGHLPHEAEPERSTPVLDEAARQLDEYFDGTRHHFELPLCPSGTAFQKAVWQQLSELDFGETTTYGEIGRGTGRPSAGRAVGGAIGANPIPIIVPCHRVLGANGRITGYSGGNGIPTKSWLLDHEGIVLVA